MEKMLLVGLYCCNKFKVISDIMAQWYLMVNAFIITINFYNENQYELYAMSFIKAIVMEELFLVV